MGPVLETTLVTDTSPATASLLRFEKKAKAVLRFAPLLFGGGALAGVVGVLRTIHDSMDEFGKTSAFNADRVKNTILGLDYWTAIKQRVGEVFLTISEGIDDLERDGIFGKIDESSMLAGGATGTRTRLQEREEAFYKNRRALRTTELMKDQQDRLEKQQAESTLGPTAFKLFSLEKEMSERIARYDGDSSMRGEYTKMVAREFSAQSKIATESLPGIGAAVKRRDASVKMIEEDAKKKMDQAKKQFAIDIKRSVWREDYSRAQRRFDDIRTKINYDREVGVALAGLSADKATAELLAREPRDGKARMATIAAGIGGLAGVRNGVFGSGGVQNKQAEDVKGIRALVEKILGSMKSVGALQ